MSSHQSILVPLGTKTIDPDWKGEYKMMTLPNPNKDPRLANKKVPMEVKVYTHFNKGRDKTYWEERKKRNDADAIS